MLSLFVASTLLLSVEAAHPPDYSEKALCDLWAGARCQVTSCRPDAKERCTQDSSRCRDATSSTVPPSRADRVAACARALLKTRCGEPAPAECEGVEYP